MVHWRTAFTSLFVFRHAPFFCGLRTDWMTNRFCCLRCLVLAPHHLHMRVITGARVKSRPVHLHRTACTCAHVRTTHNVPHVQKVTYYAHKYAQMLHFAHAHDTEGFSVIQRAKMCACMQQVGDSGKGQGHGRARVLVLGEQ